jgi:PII-like signaling protein
MLQNGLLMRIYIAESTKIKEKPAIRFLPEYFMKNGLTGCTVYRGMSGFGHENKLRTVDVFQFSLDLPVIIDVIDTKEKIMTVLPEVEKMIEDGLVTIQDVQMIRKIPGNK